MVAFVSDNGDAPLFFGRACRNFGSAMGEPTRPNWLGAVIVVLAGATPAGFRAEFEGMPEFDFSSCRPPSGFSPARTAEMGRLE